MGGQVAELKQVLRAASSRRRDLSKASRRQGRESSRDPGAEGAPGASSFGKHAYVMSDRETAGRPVPRQDGGGEARGKRRASGATVRPPGFSSEGNADCRVVSPECVT